MLRRLIACFFAAALAFPATAAAHVTLNPEEWEAGGFARFVVRVPNERDDAETTEVTVQFPESVLTARFQPHPICERTTEMETLDEPVEDVSERIASVTWTCPGYGPDEFEEFGISFRVPETPGEDLAFPSIQTYSSGEVVRWIGPPDSDTPAPTVAVLPPAEDEEPEEEAAAEEEPVAEEEAAAETDEQAAAPAASGDGGSGRATIALVLGAAGLAAGLAALALVLVRRPGAA